MQTWSIGVIPLSSDTQLHYMTIHFALKNAGFTVKPLITHTAQWTSQAMGYGRLWGIKHVLKIDEKKPFFQKLGIMILNCVC
jgi:hypothetical protein